MTALRHDLVRAKATIAQLLRERESFSNGRQVTTQRRPDFSDESSDGPTLPYVPNAPTPSTEMSEDDEQEPGAFSATVSASSEQSGEPGSEDILETERNGQENLEKVEQGE